MVLKKMSVFWSVLAISIVLLALYPMQIPSHVHSYVSKDKGNKKNENGIEEASLQTDTIKMVKNAEVMQNMTGVFEYVGTAAAGQHFRIIGENEHYFHVSFGRGTGFIKKEDAVKAKLERADQVPQTERSNESFITKSDSVVYDSNQNYDLGVIKENMRFPIVRETNKWYIIDFMGRLGSVEKGKVEKDNGVVAIMYHHFLKKEENKKFKNASTTIQPSEFEWQMKHLKEQGYVTIDMNTLEKYLLNRINLPGKVVVITMDDGLKSNVRYAAPVLRKYGFKANIYLITSRVKEHDQSWDADTTVSVSIHEMEANKDVYAYHGHTHNMHYINGRLSAMNFLPYHEALADLKENKNFLADNGFNTTHFAYPFGSNILKSQSLLSDSGFTTAFTTSKGYNKVGDNPLLLKRWNIVPGMTIDEFEAILN